MDTKKHILIITTRIPYPLIGGDRIRIYKFAELLGGIYDIDLLIINEGNVNSNHIKKLEQLGINVIVFKFSKIRFKVNALLGLFSQIPIQVKYYYFQSVKQWLDVNLLSYDLVLCNHIRSGEYLKNKNIPKIIDLHDAISLNYQRAKNYTSGMWNWIYNIEKRRVLKYEIEMIHSFDKSFIVSKVDKEFLVSHGASEKKIIVVPIAVDNQQIKQDTHIEEKKWITFVGKMNTVANSDAAMYFAKDIFPLIREKMNNTEFMIVGADPTKSVRQLENYDKVRVTGKVVDHTRYILESKVIVAPMRFGAGMQNKILQAMALGKPVVTTTIGAEGIDGINGVHFIIADSSQEFAEQVCNLFNNEKLRTTISHAAKKLIQEKYTWDTVGRLLLKEINLVMERQV